jgi:DNA-binding response OmpR family regulator
LQLEDDLRHAQKMEAVGQLAGGIAHDFNNLLTVIAGETELLSERLEPADPLRRDVAAIAGATERAAALTRQLLAFSRRQLLKPRVLDLNELVASVDAMLRRVIGEDVELVTRRSGAAVPVEADPSQLEQVVLNLAVNARDAMPDGGRLTIEVSQVELPPGHGLGPGSYALLKVSDTGTGMDAETLERVFEPFFTTKPEGAGTGLGLSTVYGIVTQSGGDVRVASTPGAGTTFEVYLPSTAQLPATAPAEPAPAFAPPATGTILLVEDDDAVRELALRALSDAGYAVLEAGDGGDALALCDAHDGPIDLLLTDVVMPEMSGRELAERRAPLRPETRVLYMSGYPADAIVRREVLDGGVELLEKPFTPMSLRRRVRAALDAD